MKKRGWTPVLGWIVVLSACDSATPPKQVPLAAVEDETIAIVCDAMTECSCDAQPAGQCRDFVSTIAADIRSTANEFGLTWDPACLGYVLDRIDATGCGAALDVEPFDECSPVCNYLHGTRAVGDTCELASYDYVQGFPSHGGITDCMQGLVCAGGVCVEPCSAAPNDPGGDVGQTCDNGCRDGLGCDWEANVCQKLPGAGQLCLGGQCKPDTFCELEDPNDPMTPMICKEPVAFGESCRGHQQCESGYCPAGFCEGLPEEGESCRGTFVCAAGLECHPEDQICVKGSPIVCNLNVPLPGGY
jgi:hypothetical protein